MKATAVAQRAGKWWAVTVPEVGSGIHTQARRLDQVAGQAADAVASVLEIPADEVKVSVVPVLAEDVEAAVAAARAASSIAAEAQAQASARMREAVARLLRDQDLTVRDAATLLGVSHQRVAQLSH